MYSVNEEWKSTRRCLVHSVGIIAFLLIYGVLQERIMTRPYDHEVFDSSFFLVFCNRLLAVICACVALFCRGESFRSEAPFWKYALVSLSNVAATACQYEALKYVSFAVQMLGKSFKMIPVMAWSVYINQKSYDLEDCLVALAVTAGVAEFCLMGPTLSRRIDDSQTTGFGYVLILGFLVFDGLTSTLQEQLFKDHKTSRCNQMLYVNILSSIISSVLVLTAGQAGSSAAFLMDHNAFARDTTILSGAAVASQYFIYAQVQEFGALAMAVTMNIRQVCAIISSYLLYDHAITKLQIMGLSIIFSALLYKWIHYFSEASMAEKQTILKSFEDSPDSRVDGGGSTC
ncbi:unnamed protein product [Durusdinium trenchii]|uniref:Adenosine 3'-phospho 5'-phosphosulfate transporter 1 n=1 Tax=Durusdinium trenchii TaxID=1381693 RepID=A0ABP0LVJ4_9DINO